MSRESVYSGFGNSVYSGFGNSVNNGFGENKSSAPSNELLGFHGVKMIGSKLVTINDNFHKIVKPPIEDYLFSDICDKLDLLDYKKSKNYIKQYRKLGSDAEKKLEPRLRIYYQSAVHLINSEPFTVHVSKFDYKNQNGTYEIVIPKEILHGETINVDFKNTRVKVAPVIEEFKYKNKEYCLVYLGGNNKFPAIIPKILLNEWRGLETATKMKILESLPKMGVTSAASGKLFNGPHKVLGSKGIKRRVSRKGIGNGRRKSSSKANGKSNSSKRRNRNRHRSTRKRKAKGSHKKKPSNRY